MPTVESAAAFERLVAARSRLNEIAKLMNEIEPHKDRKSMARYRELQTEWDSAFVDFQIATREFSSAVDRIPEEVENNHLRLPTPA